MVKYLDSNKSWVTPEVVSSNQGRMLGGVGAHL